MGSQRCTAHSARALSASSSNRTNSQSGVLLKAADVAEPPLVFGSTRISENGFLVLLPAAQSALPMGGRSSALKTSLKVAGVEPRNWGRKPKSTSCPLPARTQTIAGLF